MPHGSPALPMARAAALLFAALLCLAGCGARGADGAFRAGEHAPQPAALAIWISGTEVLEAARSPESARARLSGLAARGVGEVVLQGRANDGTPLLGAPAGGAGRRALRAMLQAGRHSGVRVSLAWPVFLGAPAPGEEPVELLWLPDQGGAVLRPYLPAPAEGPPRLDPSNPRVRVRELDALRSLADCDAASIVLTHADFHSLKAGFSDTARRGLEEALGAPVAAWPQDVLSFDARGVPRRGALWPAWARWRAGVLRDFVADARSVLGGETHGTVPALWVMADGCYPLQHQRSLNWSDPGASIELVLPDAPPGYAATGIGGLVDGLVLEMPLPAATPREAEEQGLLWWGSVEGALDVARQVAPSGVPVRAALHVRSFADPDGRIDMEKLRAAVDAAARQGCSVLLVDEGAMERGGGWETAPR